MSGRVSARKIQQYDFIRAWLREHGSASVVDQAFHDAFRAKYGGAYVRKEYGAQPVHAAMLRLREMYQNGGVVRGVLTLNPGSMSEGFPPWVYGYMLPDRRG